MIRHTKARHFAVALSGLVLLCGRCAQAEILLQNTIYWTATGTVIDPAVPPSDAWVRIDETVYNDLQGRQVLADGLASGAIHGSSLPFEQLDLFVFSITNLRYGNGPFTQAGAGIGSLEIQLPLLPGPIPLGTWGPSAAADHWDAIDAFQLGYYAWGIDANRDGARGDGFGITLGQTFNGFMFAVRSGARIMSSSQWWFPSSLATWTGAGMLDELTGALPADRIYGDLMIPVPEPSVSVLWRLTAWLSLGAIAATRGRADTRRALNCDIRSSEPDGLSNCHS